MPTHDGTGFCEFFRGGIERAQQASIFRHKAHNAKRQAEVGRLVEELTKEGRKIEVWESIAIAGQRIVEVCRWDGDADWSEDRRWVVVDLGRGTSILAALRDAAEKLGVKVDD